jgi:hypothetical protein
MSGHFIAQFLDNENE